MVMGKDAEHGTTRGKLSRSVARNLTKVQAVKNVPCPIVISTRTLSDGGTIRRN